MNAPNDRFAAASWCGLPPLWNSDEDDELVCSQRRQETHDVVTFLFRARRPVLFRFLPGQFLTLELEIDGESINRCYTISSPPTRPDTLSITVKRVPGGKVSNWLHDTLQPGMSVRALGPSGEFSASLHPAAKYLFLSGGSGVTPLMSMSRSMHDLAQPCDVVFVHSARTPKDIVFRRELGLIATNQPGFRTAFVCEQLGDEPDWSAPTGRLTQSLLGAIAPDFAEREVFCCGPEPYMAAVRALLEAAGFDMRRYHEESFNFGAAAEEEATPVVAAEVAEGFDVQFAKSGVTVRCAPEQTVLEAARAAGLRLPVSCTKGMCGTCKSKLTSGSVDMKHGGGIRQREIDQGMFLPCCSKPLSDLVLDR
ncbi:MAG TPA: hybrid-cluster NAD(P)-dependent oxidoreductase [Aromatoleum sp.]|uniref:hybrid-cluster NAD(P)-dependent oxidoreductase n=1 Tax=Aromatoleum sp. TaxID=2307007 RepID=UPI002B48B07D|nr:hybrid-cluster NAD(P)-dependent oxidoreductase [Aromatoleum sp.]HJV26817.1 hybrid-cluster NAD(P)-dependent oxidoreductase [Aromatoleum sp.]